MTFFKRRFPSPTPPSGVGLGWWNSFVSTDAAGTHWTGPYGPDASKADAFKRAYAIAGGDGEVQVRVDPYRSERELLHKILDVMVEIRDDQRASHRLANGTRHP